MITVDKEAQAQVLNHIIETTEAKLIEMIERRYLRSPFMKQKELIKHLGIDYQYLMRMEAQGLKRIQLDETDRTVFYNVEDVYKFMNQLAG